MNILLIIVDCLRADHVGCINPEHYEISPALSQFGETSSIFYNAFANGPYTAAAMPAIFFSNYYSSILTPNNKRKKALKNLPTILKEKGFVTAGFQTNPFLTSEFGYDNGFDYFDQSLSPLLFFNNKIASGKLTNSLIKAKQFTKLINKLRNIYLYLMFRKSSVSCKWINRKFISFLNKYYQAQKPHFVMLHYMDVHEPYVPPLSYRKRFTTTKRNPYRLHHLAHKSPNQLSNEDWLYLRDTYKAAICYWDDNFKTLLSNKKVKEYLKDCIVIVTADHGEELGEHGEFGHGVKFYEELLHIPLLIKLPHQVNKIEINDIVRQIDIPATIVDYADNSVIPGFKGISVRQLMTNMNQWKELPVISEGLENKSALKFAVRTSTHKLIYDKDELYDLINDPREHINISGKAKALASKLNNIIDAHKQNISNVIVPCNRKVNEAVAERFRALGYLD